MTCTRRLVRWAIRLYPLWWRKRYGAELDALLDDIDLRWRDIGSIVRGGVVMRLTQPEPTYAMRRQGQVRRAVPLVLVAVAAIQMAAILAVAGTVARGEGPLPASAAGQPPSGATSRGDLAASPRRAELVDVEMPGSATRIPTWVVYPEQSRAPVVMVVHDLYGLSDWVRSVADAFAAEGFVAVAPDLLKGMAPGGGDGRFFIDGVRIVPTVNAIGARERTGRLDAVRTWALGLPVADGRVGIVGFSWGGAASFAYALEQPELDAVVVFYGAVPGHASDHGRIAAPVLGLYGGDLPTAATVSRTTEAMVAAGRSYEAIVYEGATVFLKAQEGLAANRRATEDAWPRTLAFLRRHLGDSAVPAG